MTSFLQYYNPFNHFSLIWTCRLFLILCYLCCCKYGCLCAILHILHVCKCICMINTYKWDYGVKDVCPCLPRTPEDSGYIRSQRTEIVIGMIHRFGTLFVECVNERTTRLVQTLEEAFMAATQAPTPRLFLCFILMDFPLWDCLSD